MAPSLSPSSEGDDSLDYSQRKSIEAASLVPIYASFDGFATATTATNDNVALNRSRKRKNRDSGRFTVDDVDMESIVTRQVEPPQKKKRRGGSTPHATCAYIKRQFGQIDNVKETMRKGVALAESSQKSLRTKRANCDRATKQKHAVFREFQVRWTKFNSLELELYRLEGQHAILEKKLRKNEQAQEMVRKKKSDLDLITSTEKDEAYAIMVNAQAELDEAVVYDEAVQKGLREMSYCLEKTHVWENATGEEICNDLTLEYSLEAFEALTVPLLIDIKKLLEDQKPSFKNVFSKRKVGSKKAHVREIANALGIPTPEPTAPTEESLAAFLESVQSCTKDEDTYTYDEEE